MITLVGRKLAKKGMVFQYLGPAKACESCRFKEICIDVLEEGRMYLIHEVKESEQNCPIHEEGKVKVVQAEKAYVKALVDSRTAFEGSRILLSPPICDEECKLHDLCFPDGLKVNDRCKIIKNLGKTDKKCIKGYELSEVLLEC